MEHIFKILYDQGYQSFQPNSDPENPYNYTLQKYKYLVWQEGWTDAQAEFLEDTDR